MRDINIIKHFNIMSDTFKRIHKLSHGNLYAYLSDFDNFMICC